MDEYGNIDYKELNLRCPICKCKMENSVLFCNNKCLEEAILTILYSQIIKVLKEQELIK